MKKINGHQLRLNWTKHRNIKKINNVNDNINYSNNNTVNNISYNFYFIKYLVICWKFRWKY